METKQGVYYDGQYVADLPVTNHAMSDIDVWGLVGGDKWAEAQGWDNPADWDLVTVIW